MDENTDDQLSALNAFLQSAVFMHEMFLNLIAAGFTERQAIMFVAEILRPKD